MAVWMFNKFIAIDKFPHELRTGVAFVVRILKNRTSPPGRVQPL